jgi:phage terminase small subunit
MRDKLTGKQERYARFLFEGMSQREAWGEAGYSIKYAPAIIDVNASRLANSNKVKLRIEELRKAAEDASVATVLERKQVLTEIVRGRFADFMTGLTKEKLRSAALQEMRIIEGEDGKKTTVIKLHNPIQAADLLNKMERIYTESPAINVNVENLEAKIVQFDPREVARAIVEAIQLGLNPALLGGDGQGEDASLLPTSADIQATTIPKSEN